MDNQQEFEKRLLRLEAIEDIRRLKMRYARLCDSGYPADALSELFVEDSVWDGGESLGRYEGIDEIRQFFTNSPARIAWAMHYCVASDISVDPDLTSATGSWYLLQPLTRFGDATWLMGVYYEEYLRTDDGWRFKNVRLEARVLTSLEDSVQVGWNHIQSGHDS